MFFWNENFEKKNERKKYMNKMTKTIGQPFQSNKSQSDEERDVYSVPIPIQMYIYMRPNVNLYEQETLNVCMRRNNGVI